MGYLSEYITEYSMSRPDYKDTIQLCMGILLGCGITTFTHLVLATRKLKWNNYSYKEGAKRIVHIQHHQMSRISAAASSSSVTKSGSKNPLMRFITRLTGTGDGTEYQQFHFSEMEEHEEGTGTKRETADVECQVCPEIISKRERRNVRDDGDETPREGYVQEIFGESASTNTAGTHQQEQVLSAQQEQHTCAICLDEELGLGNTNTTRTECGHTFHLSCLLKSLNTKNLCPMCRAPLEDVRTKQMPANMLTPVSAEQLIAEEISYFSNAAHAQSISTSRHPKRCLKEALRVFGFTLLRTVAEYIHDDNIPLGWYDDGESDSESENEEGEGDDETNDGDNEGDNDQEGDNEGEDEDQDDEDDYDDYSTEDEQQARQGQIQGSQQQARIATLRGARDLRELIGRDH